VPKGEKIPGKASRVIIMFEMYVTCPITGERTYAGVLSDEVNRQSARQSFENSMCPACGARHVGRAGGMWLEIPLEFPQAEDLSINIPEPDRPHAAADYPRAAA
jgi:hypothetical protein